MAPVEFEVVPGQEALDDLERLLEALDALAGGWEVEAQAAVLLLVPRRPQPEVEAALGHVVDGHHLGGQQRGVAVGHAGDQGAQADAAGDRGQGGEQRPRLQARPLAVPVQGGEVVEHPGRFEAGLLGPDHPPPDLRPLELVLGDVDTDLHHPGQRYSSG
jgi:hypothetical protein